VEVVITPPKTLAMLAQKAGKSVDELVKTVDTYPFALTHFLRQRVEEGTYSLAALRQFLPDAQELQDVAGFSIDPAGESGKHPIPAILQAYDNRLVILLSYQCLVYCRFCVRKALVGMPEYTITHEQIEHALAFVRANPKIEDIVLSGGDPLAVPNRRLLPFLRQLLAISHVRAIRIDSRALSTMPKRIDDELLDVLKTDDRFWYHAHMNHPDDLRHPDVLAAARRLRMAGVPVLNQSVILAGVNDDPTVMARLMSECYYHKILPYNLYVLDRVKGGVHFEVAEERIVEICETLSHLPGPAQPVLIFVDAESRKHRAVYDPVTDLHAFLRARTATHNMHSNNPGR
jgi:KamA family protein